jgi:hypothetical protein
MVKKLAVAMVVSGVLALGSVGVAVAAPASGSGSGGTSGTPNVHRHINCANAPRILARIDKVEGRITARLAKLGTAEHWATQHNHQKLAQRVQSRIDKLGGRLTKAHTLANKIEAACPGATPAAGTGSGGSTGSTGSTGSGTSSAGSTGSGTGSTGSTGTTGSAAGSSGPRLA